MTTNKLMLIKELSRLHNLSEEQARVTINAVLGVIRDALHQGNKVLLSDIGILRVVEYAERNGAHPKTGEPLKLKPRKILRINTSLKMRKALLGE